VANGYIGNELRMRNNPRTRTLFAEIACVLCNSKKKYSLEGIKVKKTDFDITSITDKLKAPNVSYVSPVFLPGDPKELFIAINEFAFHISKDSKNSLQASYWLEWVMEFEQICRKKKQKCTCERRASMPVDSKFQMDPIWIMWELILGQAGHDSAPFMPKLIQSLLKLYCLRYTDGVKKKRRYLIYFAICLLTEPFVIPQEMVSNKEIIESVVKKIDTVYKQVKKNEIAPKTDYLTGSAVGAKSDLDKTIEKMDKLNAMNTIIRY
jgi:hypothetical protein